MKSAKSLKIDWQRKMRNSNARAKTRTYLYGILWGEGQEAGQ